MPRPGPHDLRVRVAAISVNPIDAKALTRKSLSLHWKLMLTRAVFQTPDTAAQGRLLNEVAVLVDAGWGWAARGSRVRAGSDDPGR